MTQSDERSQYPIQASDNMILSACILGPLLQEQRRVSTAELKCIIAATIDGVYDSLMGAIMMDGRGIAL